MIADSEYCFYHSRALDGLKEHFKVWEKAFGSISWNEFLVAISENKETGNWVKEVADLERKRTEKR